MISCKNGIRQSLDLIKSIYLSIYLDCDEDGCKKRHPNPCKFGPRCQFNKRKECLYMHVTLASDDGKIQTLSQSFNKQIEKLNNNMIKMQNEIF